MTTRKGVQGRFEGSHVRTEDGRKIDVWRYRDADGDAVEIDVALVTEKGAPLFEARCRSGFMRGARWRDSDIAALQETVSTAVEIEAARRRDPRLWTPGVLTTAGAHLSHGRGGPQDRGWRWSLTVEVEPVMVATAAAGSNDPLVEIISEGLRRHTLTHGPEAENDDLWRPDPRSGAKNLIEAMRRRPDPGKSVAIVDGAAPPVAGDRGDASAESPNAVGEAKNIASMTATLEAFGRLLTDAMAPGAIARDGAPDGERLIALMTEAARSKPTHSAFRDKAFPGH